MTMQSSSSSSFAFLISVSPVSTAVLNKSNVSGLLLQTFQQGSTTLSLTNGRCHVCTASDICFFSITLLPSFTGRRSCTTAEQKIRTSSRGQYHLLVYGLL